MENNQTSPAPNAARPPNADELRQLGEWLQETTKVESEPDWYLSAWIAVFDDYITDGPGYSGKVMCVVWGADPSEVDVFRWQDDRLKKCTGEYDQGDEA